MNRALTMLLAGAALASVGGCGGGADEKADKPAEPSSGSKAPAAKADVTVDMKDIKFKPMAVTVKKGATILWKNADQVPHNVTKEDGPGPDFASDTVGPGADYSRRFDAPGKIAYVCTIHPSQTGSITVR